MNDLSITPPQIKKHQLLSGGGEMGALIRSKDWGKTAVGTIEEWPQSLLTTLNIILYSKFPMFLWWGPELICFYNDAYSRGLGQNWKHSSILGMPAKEAWTEKWTVIKPFIDQVLNGGEATWAEDQTIPVFRNDKMEDVYWTFNYSPVNDESGRVAGVLVTCNETADNRTLAAIVHSSDDAIISKNMNGIITSWNTAAERIFGYTANEMIGQPIFKIIPADRINEEPNILAQLKKGQRVDHFETKRITKDRKILDISLTISPIRDIHGNVIGASKIARDITSQKQAERIIIESEQKFRLLADSMPQFVWTADTEGTLNYFNRSVLDYSGLSPEQLMKDGWIQIVHPDDREENIRVWMNSVKSGADFSFEHRFRRHDGEYRWQLSRAIPQRDAEGKIQMWVGTSTDIQEMKELDQQKDYFISMASHELKTPITSIKGYVQILQSMYLDKEDVFLKNSLRVIDKQIGTLTNLISDLLDLSKIKTGNLLLNKEYFQMNELIGEVIDEVGHIHPDYEISFSKETETLVFGDRERIGQVLINFITNAIKYSPGSGKVEVACILKDNSVLVSVEDSGIGISKKDQERIFERFYRVEGKNEKTFPGFGIGLFIASDIITRHNGKIGVKSEPGKGSTFYFSLPLNNQA